MQLFIHSYAQMSSKMVGKLSYGQGKINIALSMRESEKAAAADSI